MFLLRKNDETWWLFTSKLSSSGSRSDRRKVKKTRTAGAMDYLEGTYLVVHLVFSCIYIYIANGDYTGIQCLNFPLYFKGLTAKRSHFGSRPQLSKEKTAALRNAILKRWKLQRKTPSKLQTTHPEQGSFCSQVISRKGSQLPSEAEYLRAVNQRRVRTIVKSDQH